MGNTPECGLFSEAEIERDSVREERDRIKVLRRTC